MGHFEVNGTAWRCMGYMGLHGAASADAAAASSITSPDQAALPPPLPAGPPQPLTTSKGRGPWNGLGKPFSHMPASGSCLKR
eukprot:363869-Chlamydomonas_euryale.AAC.7